MYKSTSNGSLIPIEDCYVIIPGGNKIVFDNLPDISDSKAAVYNDENIIGRSNPLHTYSHSANRTISVVFHFYIVNNGDAERNLANLRLIQSAVYPREGLGGTPYQPPPVCQIRCGDLLAKDPLCVVLQNYSVTFPPDVAWWTNGSGMYCPYKFDVNTSWLVVYTSSQLPFQNNIIMSGR